MNNERLLLKKVEQKQANLLNLILCHDNKCQMASKDGYSVTVQLKHNVFISNEIEHVLFNVTVNSEDLMLAIENENLLEWVNPHFYVTDFSCIPQDIAMVIFKKTLSWLWEWFQNVYSETLELKGWELKKGELFSNEEKRKLSLSFSLPENSAEDVSAGEVNCLLINISYDQTKRLIKHFPLSKPEAAGSCCLLWPVQISIGCSYLKMRTIVQIQQSEIVFFQHIPEEDHLFVRVTPLLQFVCKITEDNMLMVIREGKAAMGESDDDFMGPGDEWADMEEDEDEDEDEEGLVSDDFMDFAKEDADEANEDDERDHTETDTVEEGETKTDTTEEEENKKPSTKESEEKAEPDELVAAQSDETPVKTEDIPVLLNFDIGSTTLPVSQLQSIKQGYCFELVNDFNDYVALRVHNQVIAKGELVKVGEHLGVEITQIVSKMESQE